MSYRKRDFVLAAFEDLGIAASSFDIQAQDLENGLRRLDAMLADWNGRGLRLGYPLPSSPSGSNLDEDTGVPDFANEAIVCNLAVRLAPSYGKNPSIATLATARTSYEGVLSRFAVPPQKRMPGGVPMGAGNRSPSRPFSVSSDDLHTGPEGLLEP